MPKYIEDFTPGETFDGASRTITETDIVHFTGFPGTRTLCTPMLSSPRRDTSARASRIEF